MEATFVRDLPTCPGATQKLWRLSEPHQLTDWDGKPTETTEYVITSAVNAMFSGPETYVFAADEDGEVTGCGELEGSFRGALDHDHAIAGFCTQEVA